MPQQKDNSTEEKIMEAAEQVFHQKGYDGARMQEIADEAGINKGLLHYYFKSKDALFEAIFSVALRRMITNISSILELEISLEEKINLIIDSYMNLLMRNSSLPRFVLNEMNKNPEKFVAKHLSPKIRGVFGNFVESVENEIKAGRIRPIDPRQLFMNIIAMIVFPFVGRPMLQVLVGADNAEFQKLLQERREMIKTFVRESLRP